MADRFKKWEIGGVVWVVAAGGMLHFAYGLLGHSPVVGLLAPVNESVWEHLKLLLLPTLLLGLAESWAFPSLGGRLWWARAQGLLAGMLVIVDLFYLYSGVWGRSLLVVEIALFCLGAGTSGWVCCRKAKAPPQKWDGVLGALVFLALFFAFGLFTFFPPSIGLFQDPATGGYGVG